MKFDSMDFSGKYPSPCSKMQRLQSSEFLSFAQTALQSPWRKEVPSAVHQPLTLKAFRVSQLPNSKQKGDFGNAQRQGDFHLFISNRFNFSVFLRAGSREHKTNLPAGCIRGEGADLPNAPF
jgi:hypothetical protein